MQKIIFNDNWKFKRFGIMPDGSEKAEPENLERLALDTSDWRELDLPHDWGIEGPFRMELDGATGKLPWAGIGWYRKQFKLDDVDKGKRIYIDIDGAMSNSSIYVNGQYLGGWPYGYNSYRIEITEAITFGAENLIAIRLDNPENSSRWYPGGGIYRNVYLVKLHPVHVAHWGTFIRTQEVSNEKAQLKLSVELENQSAVEKTVNVSNKIFFKGKKVTQFSDTILDILPGKVRTVDLSLVMEKPELWELESPKLYTLQTIVDIDGEIVDQYETSFGIRSIEYDPRRGFLLNGKLTKFKGVCEHHDLGPLGAVVNRRGIERKIELLKEMGCNAIRTSHNMPAPELIELCDRMGMLVQAESFDCWEESKRANDYSKYFAKWHEKDLVNLVRHYRNSPSIVMWSHGNEVLEMDKPRGVEIGLKLKKIIKHLDPTRPVTHGSSKPNAAFTGFAATQDVFGFNYKPHLYERFINEFPDIPFYGSETASTVSSRGEYVFPVALNDKAKGLDLKTFQVSSYDVSAPPWASKPDVEFEGLDRFPTAMGEFVWTGFDYLGEPTPYNSDLTNLLNAADDETTKAKIQASLDAIGGTSPARSSYFGIFDLCGFRKDRFYLYHARWKPDVPMVHIVPHWNWPERVGQITPVHVYTSGDEAELFLNGISLGRKKKGEYDYRLCWQDVIYEPGELKAVAYKKGRRWAENTVKTTGEVAALDLIADRCAIQADGDDLAYVTVRLVDAEGLLVPRSKHRIDFEIEGAGRIVATANGDATDHTVFASQSRRAFNGLCLVIVQPKKDGSGQIRLTAKAADLPPKTICLNITNTHMNRPADTSIYKNKTAALDDRIQNLLSKMTLDEKIGQLMMGIGKSKLSERTELLTGDDDVRKLAEEHPDSYLNKVLAGRVGAVLQVMSRKDADIIQRAASQTRLGIPILIGTDAIHGVGWTDEQTTTFAAPINMGATFDPNLVERINRATAKEMMALGLRWNYWPNVDISRDPRWGRQGETFGEDTLLVGDLGEAAVRGLQFAREDGTPATAACIKHFVGGGQAVNGRNLSPFVLNQWEIRTSFFPPFERCVNAGAMTVMAAHNEVLNVPCHTSRWLLDEVLRREWKFDGFIVTDWGDIDSVVRRHVTAESLPEGVRQGIEAGIDMFMLGDHYGVALKKLVEQQKVTMELLDRRVAAVLKIKFELGLFDQPVGVPDTEMQVLRCQEHLDISLESARKSIVLLQNNQWILPLKKEQKILITGPNAANAAILGDWVLQPLEKNAVTIVDGLRRLLPDGETVEHVDSGDIHSITDQRIADVKAAAAECDVIVFAGGEMSLRSWHEKRTCGENFSRTRLGLFGRQEELLQELYKTGKPVVLVLVNGRALCIEEHVAKSTAIIEAWEPGEFGGQAIAEILCGKVNPSGRLPVTIPRHEGQLPIFYNHKQRMMELTPCHEENEPLFWFGHGLSYTTFAYSDLSVPTTVSNADPSVSVSVTVKNTGPRDGDEVVLIYARDLVASTVPAGKQLVAYRRIHLKSGEAKSLTVEIPIKQFAIWNQQLQHVVEPGEFDIMVGDQKSRFVYQ